MSQAQAQNIELREVTGVASTPRVEKRYQELLDHEPCIDSERAVLFTDYMKDHWTEPRYLRAGGALKHVLSNLTPKIWDDELIVGNCSRYFKGTQVYPEYECWMMEGFKKIKREEERYMEGTLQERKGDRLGIYLIYPEDKEEILEVAKFWEGKDWRSLAEKYLRETKKDFDLVEKWMQQLVFLRFMFDVPEGRLIVDYQKIIDEGVEGLITRIDGKIAGLGDLNTKEAFDKYNFYQGVRMALEGLVAYAENHAKEAKRLAAECKDAARKKELLEIAEICSKVPNKPAETFREAMQSFWFTHVVLFTELNGRGISPGRFDQYMYRPFKADWDAGRITEKEVMELLELLRIKCGEISRAHATFTESYLGGSVYQNVTLGGVDRYGNPCDNELSKFFLQAGINVKTWQPTISVRWREDMSEDFKHMAVQCIKAGSGYPALFNDKLATERFIKESGACIEDARDWAPCGCVDMQICGKRMPMYAVPHTNNLKIFELVLNHGINPVTGDKLLDVKIDMNKATYEEIVDEYNRVQDIIIKREEEYWNTIMLVHNDLGLVHPIMTALLDDCIDKGKDAYEGGCRYSDPAYVISCGVVSVANSLAAIKKLVFEEKKITMEELLASLKNNFEGQEKLRKQLLDAPKYGNDNDEVDLILADLYDAWSDSAQSVKNWVGEPWRPSTLSVTTQVLHGKACGATPDGRLAGDFVADGALSAFPGTDVNGPTSLIKSATKVDAKNLQATLFNMKFNPSAIEGRAGADKFIKLNDTYFNLGGYQVQYNIVDRNMLLDAQKHPENYSDLMVRVAGFTARFIDLGPEVQRQVIERTQFAEL
ncbi:MAG TPA: pyruvate formate lyase family protein [Deltaproteobacteria bacterium]|nr:pyruvate formate lyase family protein [Deltaproteobacteria bacterium]HPJ94730.1 pyruvate formate lyase family protein [Deltaproteobacteria bacterium]